MKVRKKRWLVLAAAAAALAAVGVTMAFMFRKAGAENQFAPAEVMCRVQEQLNDDTYTSGSHVGDVKSNIRVKNTGTYYCTEAVAPGDMTGVLCEPMVLETGTGLDGSTIYQVVEVLAEAIQAAPAEAASSAWGVTIADGVIKAVQ